MSNKLEKMLQDTFGNLSALSPDAVHELVQEALETFTSLGVMSQSSDAKERENALKAALALRESLNAHSEELMKSAGLEKEAFESLAENEVLFTSAKWSELKDAKNEIEALKHQFAPRPKPPTRHAAKKKKSSMIPA